MFKRNLGIDVCVNGIMEVKLLKLVTLIIVISLFIPSTNFQFTGGQTPSKQSHKQITELGTLEERIVVLYKCITTNGKLEKGWFGDRSS